MQALRNFHSFTLTVRSLFARFLKLQRHIHPASLLPAHAKKGVAINKIRRFSRQPVNRLL